MVLTGGCIFAAVIGAFAALFSFYDSNGVTAMRTKLNRLQDYMRRRQLTERLVVAIQTHHQAIAHQRVAAHALDTGQILDALGMRRRGHQAHRQRQAQQQPQRIHPIVALGHQPSPRRATGAS